MSKIWQRTDMTPRPHPELDRKPQSHKVTKRQRITIARQRLREALYANRDELAVEDIVDAVEEYVSARLGT
jgi:hypothetical protein